MLSVPFNKGVKPFAKPTLPIGWHWFTLRGVQTSSATGFFAKITRFTKKIH